MFGFHRKHERYASGCHEGRDHGRGRASGKGLGRGQGRGRGFGRMHTLREEHPRLSPEQGLEGPKAESLPMDAGFCPICENHCPLSDPSCGKGKAFANSQNARQEG